MRAMRQQTPAVPDGPPPLEIRHNPMLGRYALTMCCIERDETYFLDAFLAHYRALGVDRFIFLDDHSRDGTFERLAAEPDVMIVGSPLGYSQTMTYDPAFQAEIRENRAVRLWRDQLMNQFCMNQWALVADTDELLCLPEGMTARALAARLGREGIEAVWGSMIEMYPARVEDLRAAADAVFSPHDAWYFDAREHVRPRTETEVPRGVYAGCRARLFAKHGLVDQGGVLRRLRRRLSGFRYAPQGILYKVPLLFWRDGDFFRNCHAVSKPVSRCHVLPIMHFKFTADLERKIAFALETSGYSLGSRSYQLYRRLIAQMAAGDGSFLCPISVRYRGYADFERAGIARLP